MPDSSDERNPVEMLAEEFMARKRQGEKPTLSEYADKYPDLADDIRELFPALLMMEDLGDSSLAATGPASGGCQPAGTPQHLGDYRILREVGRGGMGVVYEAEQESLGRRVALKVLPPHILNDSQQVRRFEREARAAAKLHHTNIVPVFGVGSDQGMHYYVMQFIQGQGLDEVLDELKRIRNTSRERSVLASRERERPEDGKLPVADARGSDRHSAHSPVSEIAQSLATGTFAPASPAVQTRSSDSSLTRLPGGSELSSSTESNAGYWRSVARIGVQVAEALEYAHSQGILHRDIKPSNLLLDMHGTVWVTDFGLAKGGDADNLTHTGDIVGTIRYMAPERFSGKSDARADVYALGITLYELLTLNPAYTERDRAKLMQQVLHDEPPRLRKSNSAIPRDLETIVNKAIAREPEHRYRTPRALAEDLQRFIEDRPIRARRVSVPERLQRWCRRNPVIAGMSAALALVFVVGFAGVAWKWQEAERQRDMALAAEQSEAEQAALSRRLGYASDMSLAYEAWEGGDTGRARELLERQWPQAGQEDLRGFEWRYLWRVCQDGSRHTLRGHAGGITTVFGGGVSAVAFAPDGKTLATGGGDHSVRIWDVASQRHIRLMGYRVRSLAFAPDGKTLAIVEGNSKAVRLWDVVAHSERAILLHPMDVGVVAFSPDGKLLATGCEDGTVQIWDVATRRLKGAPFPGDGRDIWNVAFSPDSRILASCGKDKTVRLWDVAGRREIATLLGHTGYVASLSFSPDGKLLASGAYDGTVRLWDTAGKQAVKTFREPRTLLISVAFSPDGKVLATGGKDGTIRVWDTVTKEIVARLRGHTAPVTAVAFAPDGQSLVSGSRDGTVKVWDVAAGQDPNSLTGHKSYLTSVAFSPDGKTLAVADSTDETVRIWDLATRRQVAVLKGHKGVVWCVTFSPDGKTLASSGHDGTVRLWDIGRKEQLAEFQVKTGSVGSAAFSPDGKLLAAGNWGAEIVRVWHLATGREVKLLRSGSRVRFSPDGTLLAASSSNTVRLWDVATWQIVASYRLDPFGGRTAEVNGWAFAPDGRTLAVGDAAGTLRLWDVAQKREVAVRKGHPSDIVFVAFTPDGRRLATSGADSIVKLWDVSLLQEVASLTSPVGQVDPLAFSPDGNILATAGADATVRLWQAPPLSAAVREPAEARSGPLPVETIRRFSPVLYDTPQATLVTEGNAYRVDVTAVEGPDLSGRVVEGPAWKARVLQMFDDLEEGTTYTVRFRAKADAPRRVPLQAQIDDPDWHLSGLNEVVPLTEKWKDYQYTFQPKDLAGPTRIQFLLGDQTGTVWIDDFTVTKKAD